MSELYLVRHAQASFGAANYDQLSDLGHRQSRCLGDYFKYRNVAFDQYIVGDMYRHHQTMDGICSALDIDSSDRIILPGLNEYNFQEMMQAYGDSFADDPLYQTIMKNPSDKKNYYRLLRKILSLWTQGKMPKVSEKWVDFKARVNDAQQQIQAMSGSVNRLLVIGSGGSISTFVGNVLGIPDEKIFDLNLQYKNTAVSHFFFNSEKMQLSGFNSVSHLDNNELDSLITYG